MVKLQCLRAQNVIYNIIFNDGHRMLFFLAYVKAKKSIYHTHERLFIVVKRVVEQESRDPSTYFAADMNNEHGKNEKLEIR